MAYYNVIQLTREPAGYDERLSGFAVASDPLFQMRFDWGGDPVEDRNKALAFLKGAVSAIADIDTEKLTFTFKDKDTVKEAYSRHLVRATREHVARLAEDKESYHEYHKAVEDTCGIHDLFHADYLMTASKLVTEYLSGWLPQTMYIGDILKAHC